MTQRPHAHSSSATSSTTLLCVRVSRVEHKNHAPSPISAMMHDTSARGGGIITHQTISNLVSSG